IIALTLVVPMLVVIGDICGIVGGVLVTVMMSDISYT
ncbi:MAG: ABC transporter permease, partial [Alphaproteobacteria bacterium]|nr:ABC transporter permease [Alphaproteobacteria bacterium]